MDSGFLTLPEKAMYSGVDFIPEGMGSNVLRMSVVAFDEQEEYSKYSSKSGGE